MIPKLHHPYSVLCGKFDKTAPSKWIMVSKIGWTEYANFGTPPRTGRSNRSDRSGRSGCSDRSG